MRVLIETFNTINRNYPSAKYILLLFVLGDFFFVLLHAYSLSLPLSPDTQMLRLDMDLGYAERFQSFQYVLTAILLIVAGIRTKIKVYIIWAMFFLFLFLDESFSFHETMGRTIVKNIPIPTFAGMKSQDIAELAVAAILGLVFVLPFISTLINGSEKPKTTTVHFMILTGILVFFGVGMDVVHSLTENLPGSGIFTVIEDAGEMFAASLLVWYSTYILRESWKKKPSIYFSGSKTVF